jgi:hypothetical protein
MTTPIRLALLVSISGDLPSSIPGRRVEHEVHRHGCFWGWLLWAMNTQRDVSSAGMPLFSCSYLLMVSSSVPGLGVPASVPPCSLTKPNRLCRSGARSTRVTREQQGHAQRAEKTAWSLQLSLFSTR